MVNEHASPDQGPCLSPCFPLARKPFANVAHVGVQLAEQVRGNGQQSLVVIHVARTRACWSATRPDD